MIKNALSRLFGRKSEPAVGPDIGILQLPEWTVIDGSQPEAMPRAAQLKGVLSDGTDVRIVVAGLMPTAKVRREKGWEKTPPRSIELSSTDIAAFETLLTRLRAESPIDETEAERRRKSNLDTMLNNIEKGDTVESDNYGLGHFSLPEMEMRDYMKQADNSLSEQCKIITNMLDVWFDRGVSPAPYYPRRVGIILRKAKRKDLDEVFCSEWDRHFPQRDRAA